MEAEPARAEDAANPRAIWDGAVRAWTSRAHDDWSSFESMYEQCFPIVRRYTHARVRDAAAADDLVAEIFERALRAWHTFEHRSSPLGWVLGIARHVIADHWRRSRAQAVSVERLSATEPAMSTPSPEGAVQRRDEIAALRRAIEGLSQDDQDLLALRYAAELPLAEVGSALGISDGAARVRLHRTLERLRAALGGQEE